MYCCKHVSKPKRKRTRTALYEVIEDMERKDASAKDKYGDDYEQSKLGGKIHRAFMAEVGEDMCQGEVAHHANKCPEYFCPRPEKQVHLYKKMFGLFTSSKMNKKKTETQYDDDEEADELDGKKLASRTWYWFEDGTGLSGYLPPQETPEEQVATASAYEFFRLV